MKTAFLAAALAVVSAHANAEVSGFVQLRAAERVGSLAGCSFIGCRTMVEEASAELLFEHRLSAQSALSIRVEALDDGVPRGRKVGLREATIAWQPVTDVDLKIGRQVITWGVSDYLYVNDIFPKNYDSFFTGGSFDRLKEPVDAAHLTLHGRADLEFVVSRAKADRMPSSSRFMAAGLAASAAPDSEAHGSKADVAIKASASTGGWDLAAYAASLRSREVRYFLGETGLHFDRPGLRHLGASVTGNAGSGVVWMEAALRHVDTNRERVVDRHFVGSSAKLILGYSRQIADDLTASAQVQFESALARSQYLRSLATGVRPLRDFSPVLHLRVAGHWANQTLGAGAQLFAGAEGDTHFNPFINWSPADGWRLEAGANVFAGRPDTRFGALRRDSNFYTAARYSY
jgi:hypothetical protein